MNTDTYKKYRVYKKRHGFKKSTPVKVVNLFLFLFFIKTRYKNVFVKNGELTPFLAQDS